MMGWASDAFLRNFQVAPRNQSGRVMHPEGLVHVCDSRHILGETDKAIKVRVGTTLYGEPIVTFYPKSLIQCEAKAGGEFSIWVPHWVNRKRECQVGCFDTDLAEGFFRYPE